MLKEFTTPKTTGRDIKNNIQKVLSKKYGVLNTRNLFDNVPDKDIEDNIEIAQNTIQTNIDRGVLNKNTLTRLPYLEDGLSLSFAAAGAGNSKAATKAREAAYTEEPLVKDTGIKLYSGDISSVTDLPKATDKIQSFVEEPKEKTSTTKVPDSGKNFDWEDVIKKTSNRATPQNSDGVRFKAMTQKPDKNSIYSGNIWGEKPQEDLLANDISHKDLYGFFTSSDNKDIAKWQRVIVPFIKDLRINAKDLLVPENVHVQTFRSLGNASSFKNKDMNKVANQLVDHFLSGTGNDFSSDEFTKAIGEHKETQRYMEDFTKTFKEELSNYNGNITEIMNSGKFKEALRNNRVLLSQYDYSDFKDLLGGYTFSVHSWTESDVSLKDFKINDDGTYKGVLEFTFKDNFGLDKNDLPPQYAAIPGFKSWFILQHSKKYNGKYKPFKTVVVLEKEFSGTLERTEK